VSSRYISSSVPNDIEELRRFLREEFSLISIAIGNLADGHYDVLHVAPSKPRTGDVRYADGSDWNPGSGEGLYTYLSSGAWSKL